MFKRLVVLALLAGACGYSFAQGKINELSMVVGTYTDTESHGIYSFRFNQKTGKCHLLDSLSIVNPSYLTISKDRKFIYAVSELSNESASLNSIEFNERSGNMTLMNNQLTGGADPCYVDLGHNSVFTANYSGGSLSVFAVKEDGTLAPRMQLFDGHIGGPDNVRQAAPHVHCVKLMNDGVVLASDFSADQILAYRLNHEDGRLQYIGVAAKMQKDSGPRHIIQSPDGQHVYVMSELSDAVSVFKYNAGRLEFMQSLPSNTLHARGGADIHIAPNGRCLYASSRLKGDGISIFKVLSDGKLERIGYQLTGIHPRNFNITPNGKYLLVACRDSNVIEVYRINRKTGMLTNTHKPIVLPHPVCIQFAHP
ncbi:lactonase family protein [Prevotella sp.]|uniref:lactonase family protein n=1 Tax=Prevotella sp. TaxID=59823 RepID=UPI002F930E4A